MMKLAVFGATGPTGQQVVKQALERGHSVVAIVRNPAKLAAAKHDRLEVKEADVFDDASYSESLVGCDAVLSCLGHTRETKEVSVYSQSMPAIVKAMRANNVSRLLAVTSWCTVSEPGNPWIIEWIIKPLFIGRTLANMAVMEQYLYDNCTDINYTIVRPPGLTNKPVTDAAIKAAQGQHVPGASSSISRADVARFMLDNVSSDAWTRKAVAIAV